MADSRTIQKALGGAEDLLFGQGAVSQTRNGQTVSISKINADTIPFSGDPSLGTKKSLLDVMTAYADTMSALLAMPTSTPVNVLNYHTGLEGGGGVFYWDATKDKSEHNGGTVIDPLASFPSDWNDQAQLTTWFDTSNAGLGCWVRQYDGSVNVKWFGAVGDGVMDDTKSVQTAVDYAQTTELDRLKSTQNVLIDAGTYKLSSTIQITKSNINLLGVSSGASVFYAPNSNFDLVHFDGTTLSLYQVGMSNLRFFTPGNGTSGCHLKVTRAINSKFDNLSFVGFWDGVVLEGGGKVYFTNTIFSGEDRELAVPQRYAYTFDTFVGDVVSDIHVSDFNINIVDTATGNPVMLVKGSDGIYFSNGHQNGGTSITPDGVTCASIMWNNVYFDKGSVNNLVFSGNSPSYRNFFISNCYFREARATGIVFNTPGVITDVMINNIKVANSGTYGINSATTVDNFFLNNAVFLDNNVTEAVGSADLSVSGKATISGCRFVGGSIEGTALRLNASSSKSYVNNCNFLDSTAGTKVQDQGTNNKFSFTDDYITKNTGTAVIAGATTSIVVEHGLSVTPDTHSIQVTPRVNVTPYGSFWTSSVTATTFTVNINTAPPGGTNLVFSWSVDMSN